MSAISSIIRLHPQKAFWTIACITFLFGAFLNEVGYFGLLIYGSLVGGFIVTAIADGKIGVKEYFSRIIRWRVGLKWYAIALGLPFALSLIAYAINVATGAPLPTSLVWPPLSEIGFAFLWPAFFGIALAEEPGFRGFALPRFLQKNTAIKAALIVGVLHTLWHAPFLIGMLFEGYYVGLITTPLIIISASFFFTWLFNNTNGSVLIAMLLHASDDLFSGDGTPLTFGPLYSGFSATDLMRQDVLEAAMFVTAAVILVVVLGNELGRKKEVPLGNSQT